MKPKIVSKSPSYRTLWFASLALGIFSLWSWSDYQSTTKKMDLIVQHDLETLMDLTLSASRNSLLARETYEKQIQNQLLTLASTISHKRNYPNQKSLESLRKLWKLEAITIYGPHAEVLTTTQNKLNRDTLTVRGEDILIEMDIQSNDTLILGVRNFDSSQNPTYSVAMRRPEGGAIYISSPGASLIEMRKKIGFGPLLKSIIHENPQIKFAILENEGTILAGAFADSLQISRIETDTPFEISRPLRYNTKHLGILRIALDGSRILQQKHALILRIFAGAAVFILLFAVIYRFLGAQQRVYSLSGEVLDLETHSSAIIEAIEDPLIVEDTQKGITALNKRARDLFGLDLGLFLNDHPGMAKNELKETIFTERPGLYEFNLELKGQERHFLLSVSELILPSSGRQLIRIFRDITDLRKAQQESQRVQQIQAMGELASNVAHEVRNPLNSISTLVQQIGMDFKVEQDQEEFQQLTSIILKEVRRMNQTITGFLRFARPEKINPSEFELNNFLNQLNIQFSPLCLSKEIIFSIKYEIPNPCIVNWDSNQIQQAFVNLLENAIQACSPGSIINLFVETNGESINLILKDTGKGMAPEILQKATDLYFTTRAEGSGIGLAVVQRIIQSHYGNLQISSVLGFGSTFEIRIPIHPKY